MQVRVEAGARLHVGFQNLSLSRERLYGGIGVALSAPTVEVTARPESEVTCPDPVVERYATAACECLDVPGASVTVESTLPRHVGLGSGTQTALAALTAVAAAHDRDPAVRAHAPALGRGGRSGVGVAAFERGGFIVDAGHPTERFTTAPPATGEWTVPPVVARHDLPDTWRFVLAIPTADAGRNGVDEDESMRAVVERADPRVAEDVASVLVERLLPAAAEGRLAAFGDALTTVGRLNGAWYADEQGGLYRPPVGRVVEALAEAPAVGGVGQSSWGPTVYGVTDAAHAADARSAATDALEAADVEGTVDLVVPRNEGARLTT